MVQIIPRSDESGYEIGRGFGSGISQGISRDMDTRQRMKELGMQQDFQKKRFDQEMAVKKELAEMKSSSDFKKQMEDRYLEDESYEKVKGTFGEKFADIWKAAPQGGKTELLKHGIDAKLRGQNIDQLLEGVEAPQEQFQERSDIKVPQMKKGKVDKDFQWPDYSKRPQGYTPKDWNDERKTWRKENNEVFLENKRKLANDKKDEMGFKSLEKINRSKKLPEGFSRLLINPETGEFYGLAQIASVASPEAQIWVKEIARFQNRAKDAFGSRVTNFDLQSYMKQYPSLLNTPEGRDRIIDMLQINNKLDQLYENALDEVYKHYGLNGIPQEEADRIAKGMIEEDTKKLHEEYLNLDEENEMDDGAKLSGNLVDVIGPDGQEYEVDEREVELLPEGYRIK